MAKKKSLSNGAVAGIGIGTFIVGVVVAGIVFFFLLRRQKNRTRYSSSAVHHGPPDGYDSRPEKDQRILTVTTSARVDDLIPQPVADDALTGEITKIRENIKDHVRTFTHNAPISSAINETALGSIAEALGLSKSALINALVNPSSRQDALRLVISWVIFLKTTGGRDAGLLPKELSRLSATIAGCENSTSEIALHSKWKVITGVLLQQHFGKNAQDAGRARRFANVIAELDLIVAPFVQGSLDTQQRRKNLDMILRRSADLAFLLFSQPGSFYFDFASPQGGLATAPAFFQTVGDEGQVLRPPRLLLDGVAVAV